MSYINWISKLLVSLIAVAATGCSHFTADMADNRNSEFPLISWLIHGHASNIYLEINEVDKKSMAGVSMARVNTGKHIVDYSCMVKGAKTDGQLEIMAEDGVMYFVRPVHKTRTESGINRIPLSIATTVTRESDGKLLQKVEPIYSDVPYSNTYTTGCDVEVLKCRGYMYSEQRGSRYMCLQEPMSHITKILSKNPNQWRELF